MSWHTINKSILNNLNFKNVENILSYYPDGGEKSFLFLYFCYNYYFL